MCVLTIRKKNWCAPHYGVSGRDVRWWKRGDNGGTSRGLVGCGVGWLVGWLALQYW